MFTRSMARPLGLYVLGTTVGALAYLAIVGPWSGEAEARRPTVETTAATVACEAAIERMDTCFPGPAQQVDCGSVADEGPVVEYFLCVEQLVAEGCEASRSLPDLRVCGL